MRTLRASFRFTRFFIGTLAIWGWWLVLSPFKQDRTEWRQITFGRWTKSFVKLSKMHIEVTGTIPTPPFFLVTNHLSYTDIAALRAVVKCVFVAKAEIESWPLAGRIVRDMGTIFIDRQNRRDIPRAGELIIERLDAGEGVVVFPEGTSTKGEEVLPFNSSFLEFAAAKNIPVSYASLSYRTPPGELDANLAVCWWEDIGFFPHMWRLFHQRGYTAIINFGEAPIANPDRKQLARELRGRVEKLFEPVP